MENIQWQCQIDNESNPRPSKSIRLGGMSGMDFSSCKDDRMMVHDEEEEEDDDEDADDVCNDYPLVN